MCALLMVCLLLPMGAAAQENQADEQDDAVYQLLDEQGQKITSHAGRIYQDDEYISGAAAASPEEFIYYGLAICGDAKKVSRLTGSLPLLR